MTAIEPLKSHDVTRWRIRFAYFDQQGAAHEGADEMAVAAWTPGDQGLAIFPPGQPDLATFRPTGP